MTNVLLKAMDVPMRDFAVRTIKPSLLLTLSCNNVMCSCTSCTPFSCGLLRQSLAIYNWNGLIAGIDNKSDSLDATCDDFVRIVKWHINCSITTRKVSMKERDPAYITPRIKLLLRRRNKLWRAGKAEQADIIAVKLNKLIARNRSSALAAASNKDTRQLWALLKQTGNWGEKKQSIPNGDPNLINDHFASIVSDSSYNREAVIKASLQEVHNAAKHCNDYYPQM